MQAKNIKITKTKAKDIIHLCDSELKYKGVRWLGIHVQSTTRLQQEKYIKYKVDDTNYQNGMSSIVAKASCI